MRCACGRSHAPRLIVLTGGPSAGKTAVLEVARRQFGPAIGIVPEAARILFEGGFPRLRDPSGRRAAERAIFHVARELERLALDEAEASVFICERGTLDALAYWPGPEDDFFLELGTTLEEELARYAGVVHLTTPGTPDLFDRRDRLHVESLREAVEIDERIQRAWSAHPRRHVVPVARDFVDKIHEALAALASELGACAGVGLAA